MMVQDEQENAQQEESRSAIVDCDTQQEVEPGAAPRDREAGSAGQVGSNASSVVYFIRSPDGAFVKIGFTSRCVRHRVSQIACKLPGIQLLGYVAGDRERERMFHTALAPARERGEWFRHTPFVAQFIGRLKLLQLPTVAEKKQEQHGTVNLSREYFRQQGSRGLLNRYAAPGLVEVFTNRRLPMFCRELKIKHHPDRQGGSHETFVAIGQAEEVLCG
jgi:hypothetical protein